MASIFWHQYLIMASILGRVVTALAEVHIVGPGSDSQERTFSVHSPLSYSYTQDNFACGKIDQSSPTTVVTVKPHTCVLKAEKPQTEREARQQCDD